MARVSALTQGLAPNNDHEHAVRALLSPTDIEEIVIGVAFARERGVTKIEHELRAQNAITKVFVGISNGITSKQAIEKLLQLGIFPYVVDMGTQSSIFHPKLYAAIKREEAKVILGSANLTSSGLSDNIEVSSLLELDRTDASDEQYLTDLLTPFNALIGQYPLNIFQVTTSQEVQGLTNQGKLEDETIQKKAPVTGVRANGVQAVVTPALPLHRRAAQVVPPPPAPAILQNANPQAAGAGILPHGLVWSSKPLSERDLSIPTGQNTNRTGSMYLKKGLLDGIDQRHYFKDVVFSPLNWTPDAKPASAHLLRAVAEFEIIINGIHHGAFHLNLTHNSKTNTATYRQRNAMTQVHWGPVSGLVGQPGLLGKHLSLYYLGGIRYQMEIS